MKTTKTVILSLSLLAFSHALILAQSPGKPCADSRYGDFNFWVGEWELTWNNQQGQLTKGSNKIEKVLDGCVVLENFEAPGNFIGKSWSTYRPLSGEWQQTWVDNFGGAFFLKGHFENNTMVLATSKIRTKQGELFYRMRFADIKENSFEWLWESSVDSTTWQLQWQIHYTRKK